MNTFKIILLAIFILKIGIDFGIASKKWIDKKIKGEQLFVLTLSSVLLYGFLLFLIYNA